MELGICNSLLMSDLSHNSHEKCKVIAVYIARGVYVAVSTTHPNVLRMRICESDPHVPYHMIQWQGI